MPSLMRLLLPIMRGEVQRISKKVCIYHISRANSSATKTTWSFPPRFSLLILLCFQFTYFAYSLPNNAQLYCYEPMMSCVSFVKIELF